MAFGNVGTTVVSGIYDMEPSVPRIFLSLPYIFIRHIRHPVYTTFAIYDIFFDPLGLIVLYISSGIYDISFLTKAEKIISKNSLFYKKFYKPDEI